MARSGSARERALSGVGLTGKNWGTTLQTNHVRFHCQLIVFNSFLLLVVRHLLLLVRHLFLVAYCFLL